MNIQLKKRINGNAPVIRVSKKALSFLKHELKDQGEQARIKIFEINKNKKVFDKQSLLEELYVKGQFGGHFGFNWDALNDCLTEYDSTGLEAILFVYYRYTEINKEDFDIFLNIFSNASERYKVEGVRLKLLLID